MIPRLLKAIDFIRTGQNPDGGWGYGQSRMSLVEPTAFCLLALHSSGDKTGTVRGLEFLKTCQKESGAVGIGPKDADGNWMAYAALLAFHGLGATEEERRLKSWILSFEDASGRFTQADIKSIAEAYRYDASIVGWPWTPNTTGWVEPTALFVIALIRTGMLANEKRIGLGVDLLLDRALPSGGWNFGNPYAKSHELEPNLLSTALALAALGASLAGDVSTVSLAWALLALRSYSSGAIQAPGVEARLAGLQADNGGFHGNLFETALAFLILSDAPILRAALRRSG